MILRKLWRKDNFLSIFFIRDIIIFLVSFWTPNYRIIIILISFVRHIIKETVMV